MKCKYFYMHKQCQLCIVISDKRGCEMQCPHPDTKWLKAHEWWKDNRTDDMIEFFDKLEAEKLKEENE